MVKSALIQSSETELDPEILDHPTTLKIFLTIRLSEDDDLGVREIQRSTGLKSPSTASWHLDKLVDANYIVKTKNNRYRLNDMTQELNEVDIPLKVTLKIINKELIPPRLVIPVMLIVVLLVSVVLANFNLGLGFFISLSGIFVTIIYLFREYFSIRSYLNNLLSDSE